MKINDNAVDLQNFIRDIFDEKTCLINILLHMYIH